MRSGWRVKISAATAAMTLAALALCTAAATASTMWSIAYPHLPARASGGGRLNAVDCTSPSACIAVGADTGAGHVTLPLIERWNGHAWHVMVTPALPAAVRASTLFGVACTGAGHCTAVGSTSTGANQSSTLAERLSGGRWRLQPTPSNGTLAASLDAVSCPAVNACVAVGSRGGGALTERWNGGSWSDRTGAPAPPAGATQSLSGVACTNVVFCVASGTETYTSTSPNEAGTTYAPIADTFYRGAWGTEYLPTGSHSYVSLNAISCVADAACAAVGYDIGQGEGSSLLRRANGAWNTITDIGSASTGQRESAVSCVTATSCLAVGSVATRSGPNPTVVTDSLSVTGWTPVAGQPAVDPPGGVRVTGDRMRGVSCPAADWCMEVGFWNSRLSTGPLAEILRR